jgi:L-lactate dehydrogenase complex protein LldE
MTIELFVPCVIDQFFPQVAVSTLRVLERAGVEVEYNPEQTCCGRFAYNAGFVEDAKSLGDKFLNDFSTDHPVVAPSAACVHYIKKRFPELFFNTANHLVFKKMVGNIFELTDFLVNRLQFDDFGAEFPHKVTFHDSCSALRGLGLGKEARLLLSKVKGLELIEMKQTDMCCGADLSLQVNHEPIAVGMVNHKVKNALNTGAEYIVSTDMTCLMHMKSYIEKEGLPIKVIHIAEVLASGWEGSND